MAYCDIDDVQGLNIQRGAYSTSTKPTLAQVNEFIDQIYNTINSILLARKVTTPVTTPAAFVEALKLGNAQGAGALAEMAMFPEAAGTPGGSPHGAQLWKMYQEFLKWLEKGKLPTALGAHPLPRGFFEQHPITEPTEDYPWREPKFRKNKEF